MGFDQSSVDEIDGQDISPGSVSTDTLSVTSVSRVRATLSSNQSLTAGSFLSPVPYDNKTGDNLGEFDTSTHKFTVDTAGVYIINTSAQFGIGSGGDLITVAILNNGSSVARAQVETGGSAGQIFNATTIRGLSAGDSISVRARNFDSADTLQSSDNGTYLEVMRIA